MFLRNTFLCIGLLLGIQIVEAQKKGINWSDDGITYRKIVGGNIVKIDPKTDIQTILVKKEQLIPAGATVALSPESFTFSADNTKVLLFVNSARVWRYNTRGDYWVLDLQKNKLFQIGKNATPQSLMFAKFSPDGRYVGYVSEHNLYAEDIVSTYTYKLTTDGSRKMINGTFDWVYEEEFGCRDGFRWSPDSKQIAYWQVDANKIRDYYMLNTTDSVYSRIIPVEYPKVGEAPSPVRIGVVSLNNTATRWMKIEGDPRQHYIPRMEWSDNNELVVQQLDRKQQESKLIYCNTLNGSTSTFWAESDDAWVDLNADDPSGWKWINNKKDFLWVSEKDGWRHIYKISKDGKSTTLLTKGAYDIDVIKSIDLAGNYIYFTASPSNSTQRYLYRVHVNPTTKSMVDESPELVSQSYLIGTHEYDISPTGKIAKHGFSNHNTPDVEEWISLPDNKPLNNQKAIAKNPPIDSSMDIEYVRVRTVDSVVLDAWMHKPKHFDPNKKYPLVVYVYGEPATTTVDDAYGNHTNFLYRGDMSEDGYIQLAIDNRGTPALRGAAWRKAIYRRNGQINIRDMAMGVQKVLETYSFIDKERVAVWGWSGGGSSTLNLLFQFPNIFKTGVSIAPVTNLLFYDNIYTERYMGLPQENMSDFVKGSVISHVKGLQGNLLLVHGSGDDNVHYSNAEALLNELIKYNKQFQFMEYPNRTHSIKEGEGTRRHLQTMYTNYIRAYCPPGAR